MSKQFITTGTNEDFAQAAGKRKGCYVCLHTRASFLIFRYLRAKSSRTDNQRSILTAKQEE